MHYEYEMEYGCKWKMIANISSICQLPVLDDQIMTVLRCNIITEKCIFGHHWVGARSQTTFSPTKHFHCIFLPFASFIPPVFWDDKEAIPPVTEPSSVTPPEHLVGARWVGKFIKKNEVECFSPPKNYVQSGNCRRRIHLVLCAILLNQRQMHIHFLWHFYALVHIHYTCRQSDDFFSILPESHQSISI